MILYILVRKCLLCLCMWVLPCDEQKLKLVYSPVEIMVNFFPDCLTESVNELPVIIRKFNFLCKCTL